MAVCRECRADLASGAKFCSDCGAACDRGGADVELLGTSSVLSEEAVVTTDRGQRNRLLGVLGAVAVGFLLWSMSRTPVDDTDNSQVTIEQDDTETTERPTTTTPPSIAVGRSTTTIENVGSRFGGDTGLSVLMGGESELRRLDLDTGAVTDFDRKGFPVYADDDVLVVSDPSRGTHTVVPLDDPEAEGLLLGTNWMMPAAVSAGPEAGTVWMLGGDQPTPGWQLVRLADGEVVDQVDASMATLQFGFGFDGSGGPGVSGSASGGIFELVNGEYQRVAEGRPLAVSDEFVLAENCVSPTQCPSFWLDRATWGVVDRPIPEADLLGAALSPDGRLLTYYSGDGRGVFDVERNEPIALLSGWETLTVSPDGRFAAWLAPTLTIRELDTGIEIKVTELRQATWATILFVAD